MNNIIKTTFFFFFEKLTAIFYKPIDLFANIVNAPRVYMRAFHFFHENQFSNYVWHNRFDISRAPSWSTMSTNGLPQQVAVTCGFYFIIIYFVGTQRATCNITFYALLKYIKNAPVMCWNCYRI